VVLVAALLAWAWRHREEDREPEAVV
jgi:hypothetical protein